MQEAIMSTTGACGVECHFLLATEKALSKSKLLFCALKTLVHVRGRLDKLQNSQNYPAELLLSSLTKLSVSSLTELSVC